MKNFKRTEEEREFINQAIAAAKESDKRLKLNKNYLIFISPEDCALIQEAFNEMFSYGPGDGDKEYNECLERFNKQIELNKKHE